MTDPVTTTRPYEILVRFDAEGAPALHYKRIAETRDAAGKVIGAAELDPEPFSLEAAQALMGEASAQIVLDNDRLAAGATAALAARDAAQAAQADAEARRAAAEQLLAQVQGALGAAVQAVATAGDQLGAILAALTPAEEAPPA